MSLVVTKNIVKGAYGAHVGRIQNFLRGGDHYLLKVDDDFGKGTEGAVRSYQTAEGLPVTGVIDNATFAAMLADRMYFLGPNVPAPAPAPVVTPPVVGTPTTPLPTVPGAVDVPDSIVTGLPTILKTDAYPPKAPFRPLTGNDQRGAIFGKYSYVSAGTSANPEAIRITGNWEEENIVTIDIPELSEATGGKYTRMRVHRRAAYAFKATWAAWKEAGLLKLIKSYEGAFVARYVRGSRTSLSNHAFGSAFDINYYWNQLGRVPAYAGSEGSIRELVPLAHKFGLYWGGHFDRRDGMHFEVAIILNEGEYLDINYATGTYEKKKF